MGELDRKGCLAPDMFQPMSRQVGLGAVEGFVPKLLFTFAFAGFFQLRSLCFGLGVWPV